MANDLHLTGDPAADRLLSDDPFALLIGMLLDQQVSMELAFAGPLKLQQRMEHLDPARIAELDGDEFVEVCRVPPAVHRFPGSMAARIQALAAAITHDYDGNATALWSAGDPDGGEVLTRLRALPGFGEQKARIFLALLGKQYGLEVDGWRAAAGDYGRDGTHLSIADVTGPESLRAVRESKKAAKAAKAAKAGAASSDTAKKTV